MEFNVLFEAVKNQVMFKKSSIYIFFFILTILLVYACEQKATIKKEKIDIGYELIGGDSLFLNESIKDMQERLGNFPCYSPEDYCILDDTVYLNNDTIVVPIHFTHYGDFVTSYWFDIPVKDTMVFANFFKWKNWGKREVWNSSRLEGALVEYWIKSTDSTYIFRFGAEVK